MSLSPSSSSLELLSAAPNTELESLLNDVIYDDDDDDDNSVPDIELQLLDEENEILPSSPAVAQHVAAPLSSSPVVASSARQSITHVATTDKKRLSLPCTSSIPPSLIKLLPRTDTGDPESTESHCGLRVHARLLNSVDLHDKLVTSTVIPIRQIHKHQQTITRNLAAHRECNDWAVFGITAGKSSLRETVNNQQQNSHIDRNGDEYMIVKLTDLCGYLISCFLFGAALREHLAVSTGQLIVVANPKILKHHIPLPYTTVHSSQSVKLIQTSTTPTHSNSFVPISLSISALNQMLVIGTATDFAFCSATPSTTPAMNVSVNGSVISSSRCHNVVDRRRGTVCDYHVAGEYRLVSGSRMAINQPVVCGIIRPGPQAQGMIDLSRQGQFMVKGETLNAQTGKRKHKQNTHKENTTPAENSPAVVSGVVFPGHRRQALSALSATLAAAVKKEQTQNTASQVAQTAAELIQKDEPMDPIPPRQQPTHAPLPRSRTRTVVKPPAAPKLTLSALKPPTIRTGVVQPCIPTLLVPLTSEIEEVTKKKPRRKRKQKPAKDLPPAEIHFPTETDPSNTNIQHPTAADTAVVGGTKRTFKATALHSNKAKSKKQKRRRSSHSSDNDVFDSDDSDQNDF